MLPMQFAPGPQGLVDRAFIPKPPTSANLDVWTEAASWALRFWREVASTEAVSASLRKLATDCARDVAVLAGRFGATNL